MWKALLIVSLIAFGNVAAGMTIELTDPVDGAEVPERPIISGKVSDPKATVWVVVHPMEVSDRWVQPAVTVRRDGTWKVQVYIGRPGNLDVGKSFVVRAIANPKMDLREGMVIPNWPESAAQSDVVEWKRGK